MRTSEGFAHIARTTGDPSSTAVGDYAPACYLAVSTDDTVHEVGQPEDEGYARLPFDPDDPPLTLPGEITSGTLARVQGTWTHYPDEGYYTVRYTFTSDRVVTLRKTGLYKESTGGTVLDVASMNPATMRVGDQAEVVHKVWVDIGKGVIAGEINPLTLLPVDSP